MSMSPPPIGSLLRTWRQRRRISQLDLAVEAEISPKHLSFVETGRAMPSRAMVLRLAEQLEVPLREQNILLVAAGYAPVFPERSLDAPELAAARRAVELVLRGHEPFPALAIDRHWTLLAANRAVMSLLAGAAPHLLAPPINVLRLSLHPAGLAPRIANYGQWRGHLLARLQRQIELSADPGLAALHRELTGLAAPPGAERARPPAPVDGAAAVVVPLRLHSEAGLLCLLSTTTIFGTPVDITVAELAIESFFPADAATAELLSTMLHQA